MIFKQMKISAGKGLPGYRLAMITLELGGLGAAICVNENYRILQAKYSLYESDFKAAYNQPYIKN